MCGAGIVLSKRPFRSFIVLVGQRIPWWLKLWVGLLGGFIGNVQFRRPPQDWEEKAFDRFMGLVYSSTVRGFGQIRFVGSLQGIEVLRLEDIIAPSILLILFPSHGE